MPACVMDDLPAGSTAHGRVRGGPAGRRTGRRADPPDARLRRQRPLRHRAAGPFRAGDQRADAAAATPRSPAGRARTAGWRRIPRRSRRDRTQIAAARHESGDQRRGGGRRSARGGADLYLARDRPMAAGKWSWRCADTGCGMDEETEAGSSTRSSPPSSPGAAWDWPAVMGIIRAHRGTISVDSIPGKGSKFTVALPCVAGARQEDPSGSAQSAS